jgi:hypothetical protein
MILHLTDFGPLLAVFAAAWHFPFLQTLPDGQRSVFQAGLPLRAFWQTLIAFRPEHRRDDILQRPLDFLPTHSPSLHFVPLSQAMGASQSVQPLSVFSQS